VKHVRVRSIVKASNFTDIKLRLGSRTAYSINISTNLNFYNLNTMSTGNQVSGEAPAPFIRVKYTEHGGFELLGYVHIYIYAYIYAYIYMHIYMHIYIHT
jgi:hypothetical protein